MENGQEINEVVNNFTDNIEEKRCPECGNRITDKWENALHADIY